MVNIQLYNQYFYFDLPAPYQLNESTTLNITPVSLLQSETFLRCIDLFQIDKNASPSVEIIQMSYLEFILKVLLSNPDIGELYNTKLSVILGYCLGIQQWALRYNENGKLNLIDVEKSTTISSKQFDDIMRIILYQNLPHYDDTYINPDLKKAMQEVDAMKQKNIVFPNTERKIAIITAHTGLPKKAQLEMTLRSHNMLFEEVCGEVEFTTVRPIALFGGKSNELDHWLYPKQKGKYDEYVTSVEEFNKSMGGSGAVPVIQQSN